MAEGIVISVWMSYCLVSITQIIVKAYKFGDNPIAHRYAKRKGLQMLIASAGALAITFIIYIL